jgi:glycosyltransferase involved in cell wall biosynthesis
MMAKKFRARVENNINPLRGGPDYEAARSGSTRDIDSFVCSFVTINMNSAEGLRRTCDSLQQLREDQRAEFILIDGGSTDGSLQIASAFYEPGKLISEPDNGIYHAMNKGLTRSRGRYIVWINSGDELAPDSGQQILDRLDRSTHDVICCSALIVDISGRFEPHTQHAYEGVFPNQMVCHQACLFRRQAVLASGGYREDFKIVGDHEFLLRLYYAGARIKYSSVIAAIYYTGGISSGPLRYRELIRVNYEYGLYSRTGYLGSSISAKTALGCSCRTDA